CGQHAVNGRHHRGDEGDQLPVDRRRGEGRRDGRHGRVRIHDVRHVRGGAAGVVDVIVVDGEDGVHAAEQLHVGGPVGGRGHAAGSAAGEVDVVVVDGEDHVRAADQLHVGGAEGGRGHAAAVIHQGNGAEGRGALLEGDGARGQHAVDGRHHRGDEGDHLPEG